MSPARAADPTSPSWARSLERACEGVGVSASYQLLGRPGPPWATLSADIPHFLRSLRSPADGSHVRHLIEVAPWLARHDVVRAAEMLAGAPDGEVLVILDERRRACGLLDADHALVNDVLPVLCVAPGTSVVAAARRALTRPPADRFRPLVCADATGRYLGIIRMERIVDQLAQSAGAEKDNGVELSS